jgi:hypothetical protein
VGFIEGDGDGLWGHSEETGDRLGGGEVMCVVSCGRIDGMGGLGVCGEAGKYFLLKGCGSGVAWCLTV